MSIEDQLIYPHNVELTPQHGGDIFDGSIGDKSGLVRFLTACHSFFVPAGEDEFSLLNSRLLKRAIARLILTAIAEASSNLPCLIRRFFPLRRNLVSGVM